MSEADPRVPGHPFPDHAGRPSRALDVAGWDGRWGAADTPWDLGAGTPPLLRAVRSGLVPTRREDGAPARTVVIGCGAGHDARALAAEGLDVTGVDFAPTAIAKARDLATAAGSTARFLVADLFALPAELRGADLVVEHTLFCAIDPSDRDRYVDAVADVLRPGGLLLALFWLLRTESGPPFGASEPEIVARFARRFDEVHAERPADSLPSRPNERLTILRRAR